MSLRPATEMRPREVLRARDTSGCAFVPVSPLFEWHSYHLPLGCDGIIAESLACLAAELVDGVWFPALSFGLDRIRPEEELHAWGFDPTDRVFGMNFPELPLASEYCDEALMRQALLNRVRTIRTCGFRHLFIVSAHGGYGQVDSLQRFAKEFDSDQARLHLINTDDMLTLSCDDRLGVGGHAGCRETLMLLALRPELADLSELPDGALRVRQYGIQHCRPVVEEQWNPRTVTPALAGMVRENVLANMMAFVRRHAGLGRTAASPQPAPAAMSNSNIMV